MNKNNDLLYALLNALDVLEELESKEFVEGNKQKAQTLRSLIGIGIKLASELQKDTLTLQDQTSLLFFYQLGNNLISTYGPQGNRTNNS